MLIHQLVSLKNDREISFLYQYLYFLKRPFNYAMYVITWNGPKALVNPNLGTQIAF